MAVPRNSERVKALIGAMSLPVRKGTVWGPALGKLPVAGLVRSGYRMLEQAERLPASEGVAVTAPLAKNSELRQVIVQQFEPAPGAGLPDPPLRPAPSFDDIEYYLPTAAMADQFFADRMWLTNEVAYWAEVFDCDDYAYCLKTVFAVHRLRSADTNEVAAGIAAGIYWGGKPGDGHVLNFVVTSDAGIRIYDATPSNRSTYSADEMPEELFPTRYIVI